MKAVPMNEETIWGGEMTGMKRFRGNRDLGGHAGNPNADAALLRILAYIQIVRYNAMHSGADEEGNGGSTNSTSGGGLVVTADNSIAIDQFKGVINNFFDGKAGINVEANTGKVSLHLAITGFETIDELDKLNMTEEQWAMFDILLDATDESKPLVEIKILQNSQNVLFGQAFGGEIDITDIIKVGKLGFVSSAGILAHELYEQTIAQRDGLKDSNGQYYHDQAILKGENLVNGSTRGRYASTTHISEFIMGTYRASNYEVIQRAIKNGNLDIEYKKNGIVNIVQMIIVNNNVAAVTNITK